MKRNIFFILFFLTILGINLSAQSGGTSGSNLLKPAKEFPVLKPTFIVSDIYIAIQILDGIELTGNEVEAFLDVKKNLRSYLETAQNQKLKVNDEIKVELPGHLAQNTLTFLSRSVLKGNMAEQYKRFVDAIVESSKTEKK